MPGTAYQLEITPHLPERLKRLDELANNLWYSWDRATRTLFARLHATLWQEVGHSPKSFLKRISQRRLDEAAEDPVFLGNLNKVLSAYDTYHEVPARNDDKLPEGTLVAYFCAEFGFHESLPIYSGGLGILAGDHCKAASDLSLPFVGVGLLYRQGYFLQSIDNEGVQHPLYRESDFDDLPILPVLKVDGSDLKVSVSFPGRDVIVKVWQARVGHITLYLLDTDLEENSSHDRDITHRLYGGDRTTRIEQEIILGVAGVRALFALGLSPTAWHINEGHAAFQILERIHHLTTDGLDFPSALEAVAANTVFTTHTPVPAGHDYFDDDMVRVYFEHCCDSLHISPNDVLSLGHAPGGNEFNMTALAIHGSRFHNGVSRIHGSVSSDICSNLWPQIEPQENPIDYITNGVHAATFLSEAWNEAFDNTLGHGWSQRLMDHDCWNGIHAIPDHQFWSIRQSLKSEMLHLVRNRIAVQHARNHGSQAHLDRVLKLADPKNPNVLTIGFARRFATYKRATLLLQNPDWLKEIVSNPDRPVLFIFAGKAHPADKPGQELIRWLSSAARTPEFEGKILLLEGYDLRMARRLVSGVDVWLNNPIYPLEASGTSGIKAAMNGVLNLSVLDGWWDEGYDGTNGWAIKPASDSLDPGRRDQEESRTLYEILQDQVIPLFYDRGPMGYSPGWVAMAKRSIASIMPSFNAHRMVTEYVDKFYRPASKQCERFYPDSFAGARDLAAWKAKVRQAWGGVSLTRLDSPRRRMSFGETLRLELAVKLNGLAPADVKVELLFGRPADGNRLNRTESYELHHERNLADEEFLYSIDLTPDLCGQVGYQVRVYPNHGLLTHPFEMGMMIWL
jgi:starch phosphorylase